MEKFKKSIVTTVLSCMICYAFSQQPIAPLPKCKNGFIVIAHRGYHLEKPENTIASIHEAIMLGVDYVELDLRTTKDGRLVLSHNETVDSKTNGKGHVRDLTWNEISKLETKSKDGKVYRIPAFSEVLAVCKGKINIYLDFKEADVNQAYKQIRAAGMEQNILVYSNNANQYLAWRRIAPKIPQIGSLPEWVKNKADLTTLLKKTPLEVVDNVNDSSLLALLRENGVNVFLDVQGPDENPAKWKSVMGTGILGVQTDHPEALISYLNDNQLRDGVTVLSVKYRQKEKSKLP